MEKIKVNMSPNPLDIQTIHCSQGDTEAREWEFELHNNGEVIDSSSISDQLVFKAYKGGTEEILPTNGSTPTTSPFKGDIKYPQGLLSDQEFLYRESPAIQDGLARIDKIKGNTLIWNQLVPSLSTMSVQNGTISVADNVATITISSSASYLDIATAGSAIEFPKGGHKYLLTAEAKSTKAVTSLQLNYGNSIIAREYNISANTWTKVSSILSNSSPTGQYVQIRVYGSFEQGDTMQVRNWNYFDLTAMGLDSINTIEEFTSLFPKPYYAYNQGTLLSFMGNGIKTVGFNQWDEEWEVGSYSSVGEKVPTSGGRIRSINKIPVLPSTTYYMAKGVYILCQYDANKSFISFTQLGVDSPSNVPHTVSLGANTHYIAFATYAQYGTTYKNDICINISNTERNGTYEPYTSSTLSLPISTYFPTGMKRVEAYDELTPTKATTRISVGDLGTLNWAMNVTSLFSTQLVGLTTARKEKVKTALYQLGVTNFSWSLVDSYADKSISTSLDDYIYIKDTSYTDASAFKTAMNGIPLYYELATPTETPITTASLVTENAEIPLSNEDGVLIGKCTEQLSENPGFIDAKIKLADDDGECYSNKIQLHVERSPQ